MEIDEERIEMPWDDPIRIAHHRESASNALAEARCPRCDAPMRLRYGRNGVVFVCGCAATWGRASKLARLPEGNGIQRPAG